MLVIQPTADGRLRIYNNHRSDFARDETSARTLAYNWGHTDISINKALSEMRTAARGEAQPTGWRVTRPEPAKKPAAPKAAGKSAAEAPPAPEPAPRVEMTAPVAERGARARKPASVESPAVAKPAPNTVLAPAKPVPPVTKARVKAAPVKAAAKAVAETTPKKPAKAVAEAPEKKIAKARAKTLAEAPPKVVAQAAAKRSAKETAPREKALSLFRAGVKELAGMEEATLAFARGPWSELREMAEYITACLEGKRPKTGWERK